MGLLGTYVLQSPVHAWVLTVNVTKTIVVVLRPLAPILFLRYTVIYKGLPTVCVEVVGSIKYLGPT